VGTSQFSAIRTHSCITKLLMRRFMSFLLRIAHDRADQRAKLMSELKFRSLDSLLLDQVGKLSVQILRKEGSESKPKTPSDAHVN
jgi:hypothetical protein